MLKIFLKASKKKAQRTVFSAFREKNPAQDVWQSGTTLRKWRYSWREREKNTSSPFKRGRTRWERPSGWESVTQSFSCGPGRAYNAITPHFANGVKKDKEGRSGRVGRVIHLALECMALPSFSVWCPLTNPVPFTPRGRNPRAALLCVCYGSDN